MAKEEKKSPTVADLRRALKDFPDDATWWAYEGEVSGIIISSPKGGGVIHNDGRVDNRGKDPSHERRKS